MHEQALQEKVSTTRAITVQQHEACAFACVSHHSCQDSVGASNFCIFPAWMMSAAMERDRWRAGSPDAEFGFSPPQPTVFCLCGCALLFGARNSRSVFHFRSLGSLRVTQTHMFFISLCCFETIQITAVRSAAQIHSAVAYTCADDSTHTSEILNRRFPEQAFDL